MSPPAFHRIAPYTNNQCISGMRIIDQRLLGSSGGCALRRGKTRRGSGGPLAGRAEAQGVKIYPMHAEIAILQ